MALASVVKSLVALNSSDFLVTVSTFLSKTMPSSVLLIAIADFAVNKGGNKRIINP